MKSVGPNEYVTTKSGSGDKLVDEGAAFSKKYIVNMRGSEGSNLKKSIPDVLSYAAAAITERLFSFFTSGDCWNLLQEQPLSC